jgi:hypothetical protein
MRIFRPEDVMQPLITDETTQASNGIATQPEPGPESLVFPKTDALLGRVASPVRQESTSEHCDFWVQRDRIAEKSQIVRIDSQLAGQDVRFYGLVEEVYRRSRLSNIHEAFDGTDGDAAEEAPFEAEGVTYASVSILQRKSGHILYRDE